jgi:predicted dehydrogenase
MSTDKLRVGVIGAGLWAVRALIPQLRATGRAEVIAIARRTPERLYALQKELDIPEAYTDWREMLDKSRLDAVMICTPHNAHVAPAVAALNRGLHVFLEKPAADTIDGALQIAETAEKSGRVLTVGFNSRASPVWRGVRSAVHASDIGPLRQINLVWAIDGRLFRQRVVEAAWIQAWRAESDLQNAMVEDWMWAANWRRDAAQMGGDALMDSGAHAIDVLLWIANAKPVEVVAFKTQHLAGPSATINLQTRLANGVLISVTFTDRLNEGDSEWSAYGVGRTTLLGDCGVITIDSVSLGVQSAKEAWMECNGVREQVQNEGEWIDTPAAWVNTILDGAPNLCSAEEGAQSVALIQSAYRSAAERQIVKVM